ncbi:MAG: hypothetical protein HOK62_01760 [Verrucomicrobiales bacterium]|nr:hypothetical protein [Verrucomicrobiales bacterium]
MTTRRAKTLDSLPKPVLGGLIVLLLALTFLVQGRLNEQRAELSHNYLEPLQNAPPMLVLATQALSGFRGIISSYLWLRANEAQLEKRYQEQMQLSQWVSQLQPNVPTVWANRSWNMAYNISVKYPDGETRWMYVQEGIRLLRDEGIRYCPQEPIIYHELSWIFQHKVGHNMDDHHRFYKRQWMNNMTAVLWATPEDARISKGVPNFDELINPPNEEVAARVRELRKKYRLDPREIKAVAIKYGRTTLPNGKTVDALDWRIPETHSIYWAYLGLKRCSHNPSREKALRKLERIIYQSMMYAFERGKLNWNPFGNRYEFQDVTGAGGSSREVMNLNASWSTIPNLDITAKAHEAYEEMIKQAQESRGENIASTFGTAHFNFLRRAANWFYYYNREEEARQWLMVCAKLYPDKVRFYPGYDFENDTLNLDEFVRYKLEEDVKRGNFDKTQALFTGLLIRHFTLLGEGDAEESDIALGMAKEVVDRYNARFANAKENRVSLPPFEVIRILRMRAFLLEESPVRAAMLRTAVGLADGQFPEVPEPPPAQGPSPGPGQ